jgi:hypothetical protein
MTKNGGCFLLTSHRSMSANTAARLAVIIVRCLMISPLQFRIWLKRLKKQECKPNWKLKSTGERTQKILNELLRKHKIRHLLKTQRLGPSNLKPWNKRMPGIAQIAKISFWPKNRWLSTKLQKF